MERRLPRDQARRIALAAQGFCDPPPTGRVDVRHLRRVLDRVGVVQIDSVNVLARAHYLPAYSRLGPYPTALLDDLAYRRRELFEYWGHEASLIRVDDHRLYRHRMAGWRPWQRVRRLQADDPGYIDRVEAEIAERGPLQAAELTDPGDGHGSWWGWSKGKVACEWLFATGRVAVADRWNFARRYDLCQRVLPAEVLAAPTPAPEDAQRALLSQAARSLGVATAADLADYHRLRVTDARPRIAELVAAGDLEPVAVDGWGEPAYLHADARLPRRTDACALLSPFDPLVWFRPRAERLFGFRYRIEIYRPVAQRTYGYYVLPFLLGERLVARVDLKADRTVGRLLVHAAWIEPDAEPERVAVALAGELDRLARWQQLPTVVVASKGNLAPQLARAVAHGSATV